MTDINSLNQKFDSSFEKNEVAVIVGGVHDYISSIIFKELETLHLELIIFEEPERINLIPSALIPEGTKIYSVNYLDKKELFDLCEQVLYKKQILQFIAFREKATLACAYLNEKYGLEWSSPESIELIRNKFEYNKLLFNNSIPVPWCEKIHGPKDLEILIEKSEGEAKYIFKPITGLGSVDVVSFPDKLETVLKILHKNDGREFMIEEFVNGEQFSIDGMIKDGEVNIFAYTKKEMFDETFVASRQFVGFDLEHRYSSIIEKYLHQILSLCKIIRGFFHLQFWIDKEQITFGEIHNRLGGSFIGPASAVFINKLPYKSMLSTNMNQIDNQLTQCKQNKILIEVFKYPEDGILENAWLPNKYYERSELIKVHFYKKTGTNVSSQIKTTFDHAGFIVVQSPSFNLCLKLANNIKKEIHFRIN